MLRTQLKKTLTQLRTTINFQLRTLVFCPNQYSSKNKMMRMMLVSAFSEMQHIVPMVVSHVFDHETFKYLRLRIYDV